LVGTKYWQGLKDWIQTIMMESERNINPQDLELLPIVDEPEEVIRIIDAFYAQKEEGLGPNYNL
jgi:predicted Rossmann-fold nucleotide-binding protein